MVLDQYLRPEMGMTTTWRLKLLRLVLFLCLLKNHLLVVSSFCHVYAYREASIVAYCHC